MGREADLLRMLEPAVRPGGLPAATRPATRPIDHQDFEALLAEAAAGQTAEDRVTDRPRAHQAGESDPLRSLAGPDRIENASLRQIVAGGARPADSTL